MLVTISPPARIGGTVSAPPSKSMAHRAVLCSALAKGTSHIENLEFSKDISATLAAAGQLCARVESGPADVLVEGLGHFRPVFGPVDCCESGSTLRFLIPLASLTGQSITFVGRGRLMERPQSVYETLYREQNLHFEQANGQLTVAGSLRSGEYTLAGNVSSQFISGLLFALPLLAGDSTLHLIPPVESRSYIEMTRAAQAAFGVTSHWLDDTTLCIPGGQQYHPRDYIVEGDYSQAAFLAVLGAVKGGITLTGLAAETLQGDAAILDILRRCGAKLHADRGRARVRAGPAPRRGHRPGRLPRPGPCADGSGPAAVRGRPSSGTPSGSASKRATASRPWRPSCGPAAAFFPVRAVRSRCRAANRSSMPRRPPSAATTTTGWS